MKALVFILLCLIWGSTWIAIKLGLQDSPPMYTLLLRFIVATAIVNLIVLIKKFKYPSTLKELWYLGYPGIFMFTITYFCTYHAEQHISSALTAVLYASIPLDVALLSVWFLPGERIRTLGWCGLFCGFLGIVLISYDQLMHSAWSFYGSMLAIIGAFGSAVATITIKRRQSNALASQTNVLVTVAVQMFFGLLPMLILTPLMEDWSQVTLSPLTVGTILYLAVIGTVVAFLSYYWLLTKLRAVVISLTAFVIPLVAIIIGVLFFDEHFRGMLIPGTMLILLSVLLVMYSRRPAKTT